MPNKQHLKKDASPVVAGRQLLEVAFIKATPADFRKQMDVAGEESLPEGYIAGWASTPDLDLYRHVVMPGAFDESIVQKGLNGPKGIKLLIGHDRDKPAGVIKKLQTVNGSLWIEAQLNLKVSYVRDMYEIAKENDGFSFSVGFYLEEYEHKLDSNKNEYLQINKGELEEVSLVVFPGNVNAVNTYIKGITDEEAFADLASMEKALVASGLVKSRNDAQRLTRAVKRNLALFRSGAAEAPKPAPVAKEKLDALSALTAELKGLFETR